MDQRAERAIPVAARLACAGSGRVVLLRVVGPLWEFSPLQAPLLPSASAQMLIEGERVEASSYLARLATSKELAGVEIVMDVSSRRLQRLFLKLPTSEHVT